MTYVGADYAFLPHPIAVALSQAGIRYVYRYIGAGSGSKLLTADEVQALHSVGLPIGFYVEGAAPDIFAGRGEGQFQAGEARTAAISLGIPDGCVYIFAADEDITSANINSAVDYFRGVNDIFPASQVGAYCDTDLAPVLRDLGLATFFVKPAARSWSQSQFPYDVIQLPGEINIGGGMVDSLQSDTMPRGLWYGAGQLGVEMKDVWYVQSAGRVGRYDGTFTVTVGSIDANGNMDRAALNDIYVVGGKWNGGMLQMNIRNVPLNMSAEPYLTPLNTGPSFPGVEVHSVSGMGFDLATLDQHITADVKAALDTTHLTTD